MRYTNPRFYFFTFFTNQKSWLTFGADPVHDTDSGSLIHFPHHSVIRAFSRFISICSHRPITTLGEIHNMIESTEQKKNSKNQHINEIKNNNNGTSYANLHITFSHDRYFTTNLLLRFSTTVLRRSNSNCAMNDNVMNPYNFWKLSGRHQDPD